MDFEFLVHGKPNNYDFWGNNAFDSIEEKVCKEYFDQKEYLPERGHLVEIRSWKNTFYSIYSFVEKVKDTSKRPSYCAVSLIFKWVYCRKCSDLFALLEEVYEKKLVKEAKIIDPNRVFQINWFNNASASLKTIEKLTGDCIKSQFHGMFDEIDESFTTSLTSFPTVLKCNPKDCDAESFFDELRKEGRIIVSESTPSKDSLLAGQIELKKAYDEARGIADTVPSLKESIQEADNKILKLNAEKEVLSSEKEQLVKQLKEKELIINDLKGKLTEKEKEIDFAIEKLQQPLEKIFSKIEGTRNDTKKSAKGWLRITPYIPIVNLLLLLLLSFLSLRGLSNYDKKKDGGTPPSVEGVDSAVRHQGAQSATSDTPYPVNSTLSEQPKETTGTLVSDSQPATQLVANCGLQVKDALGHPLSDDAVIEKGKYLTLSVEHPRDGYSWHISNGEFSADEKTKPSFMWKVNAPKSGDVIITYRPESEEARKNNPNRIALKIN